MGVYLKYEGVPEPEMLASTTGWGDVIRWLPGLHPDKAPCLNHLTTHGWEQDLDDLAKEIPAAMKAHPPKQDVKSTLENLFSLLKARPDDCACVTINQGMTADSSDEEQEEDEDEDDGTDKAA